MEPLDVNIEDLKAEATGLGIKFNPNIGADKLQAKIDNFYESQTADDSVKEKPETPEEPTEEKSVGKSKEEVLTPQQKMRKRAAEMRIKAFKTRIVRITSNDKRTNDVETTAYLGFENQFFGRSKLVPLDVPVELEQCLINVAKTTRIVLHKDEIVDGKRTGNKVPVMTNKYNVSYEEIEPTT